MPTKSVSLIDHLGTINPNSGPRLQKKSLFVLLLNGTQYAVRNEKYGCKHAVRKPKKEVQRGTLADPPPHMI